MKILCYMATPGGLTGAPRRLLGLAQALQRQGHEVCLVSDRDSELLTAAESCGLETVGIDPVGVLALRGGVLFGGGFIFRVRVLLALLIQNFMFYRVLRRSGADVCWTRGSKGIAFVALGTLAGRRSLVWDIDYEPASVGVVRLLHRFGLWAARRVVFQYGAAAEEIFGLSLMRRHQDKYLTLIPGLDLGALQHSRVARRDIHAQGRRHSLVMLQVGTICERKNQQLLIAALGHLKRERATPDFEMQFAGGVFDADYARSLTQAASALGLSGNVKFLGWREDVHDLMSRADLLLMPSRDEGVPNAVQEAMAIGLPVLVSDAGGMPEVVSHDVTGWVLPDDDPSAWAERIGWCMDNVAVLEKVAGNAMHYADENFTTEVWGKRYAAVFSEAASNR